MRLCWKQKYRLNIRLPEDDPPRTSSHGLSKRRSSRSSRRRRRLRKERETSLEADSPLASDNEGREMRLESGLSAGMPCCAMRFIGTSAHASVVHRSYFHMACCASLQGMIPTPTNKQLPLEHERDGAMVFAPSLEQLLSLTRLVIELEC